jgi:hypothetical protein
MQLPVRWNATSRTWDGLVERVVQRRGNLGPFVKLRVDIVIKPVLARLVGTDPWMTVFASVLACMLRWGGVAAADMSALRAPTQVEPPTATDLALRATRPAGRYVRIDSRHKLHYAPPG